MSDNIGAWFYDESDPTAKAYEDAYWTEWDQRDTVIAASVQTWDDSTSELFLKALDQAVATRVEEREEVRDSLEPIGYDGQGALIYSWSQPR